MSQSWGRGVAGAVSGPDANGAGAPRELPAGAGRSPESLTGIVRCLHEPPRQPQAVNADTGSALQMRRSNIREVKSLRQRHTATKWQPQARCQSGLVIPTGNLDHRADRVSVFPEHSRGTFLRQGGAQKLSLRQPQRRGKALSFCHQKLR